MDRKIVGVILTGGDSSRIGFNKANVRFRGESLLEKTIKTHEEIVKNIYLIGKSSSQKSNIQTIKDKISNIGPIGGIYTAMLAIESDLYLITPCDMPFLTADILKELLRRHTDRSEAVILRSAKGIEPLVGVYSRSVMNTIRTQIEQKKYALYDIIKKINTEFLDVQVNHNHHNLLFNLNTIEDYQYLRKWEIKKK